MKFYKRDPDRALAGMAELSLQERGAYNTIIDALYSRDGVLRDDDDMLRRIMGCHGNEWRAVKGRLIKAGKIWIEAGYVKAKRVDETLQEASTVSDRQRKTASKRWENEEKSPGKVREKSGKRPRNASEISEKANEINDPHLPLTPIDSIKKERDIIPSLDICGEGGPGETNLPFDDTPAEHQAKPPDGLSDRAVAKLTPKPKPTPDGWADFWTLYPRRVAKQAALKAYRTACAKASPETIARGLTVSIDAWRRRGTEPDYIPHPATWLNAGQWEDDPLPSNYRPPGAKNGYRTEESDRRAILAGLGYGTADDHDGNGPGTPEGCVIDGDFRAV